MNKLDTKKRINISVSEELDHLLEKLAARDQMPVATKVLELIKEALQIEEDAVLNTLAEKREKKHGKYISHEKAWK